jgi:hypothetical protein
MLVPVGFVEIEASVDESLDRLHRAGWSIGDVGTPGGCLVSGPPSDVDQPYCLLRREWLGLRLRRLSPDSQAGFCTIVL